jgi:isoquinoline 1-oxidoreductase beta subunit
MRVAGAAARQVLLEAASEAWGVPVSQLRTDRGQIFTSDGRLAAPFSDFAAAAGEKTPPHTPTLKTPDQYRYMGKSLPRHDLPAKVDGSAVFGIDVMVPGMKIATVMACPTFGGTLARVPIPESLPAGSQVVELDDAVAVVSGSYWEAKRALATLTPEWHLPEHSGLKQAEIYEAFEQAIAKGLDAGEFKSEVDVGDTARVIETTTQPIDVTYRAPYLAHACMEPMNATAHVVDDRCEIWVGTQNPLGTRHAVAEALDIPPANVTVHNHIMGGGFGRRSIFDATIQAAKISRIAGVPVKLIWSREEDMQHDFYRPAFSSRFQGVVSSSGTPTAWRNVFVNKSEPHEAPHIPYAIANISIGSIDLPMPIPEGPWRSVDSSQHAFFTESFIDELAHAAAQDPLQFRRSLLQDQPRYLAILEALEQASDWHKPLESGRARGIALHESFGSIVGEVVQVNVTDQRLVVERVVCVADPGFAMSPDGFKAQMESGIIYGLSAALTGQVEIESAQAKPSNFHDYPVMRMKDSPVIDVIILNSGAAVGGAGEPGTPPAAPALANAVFAATAQRIRELPLSLHGFKV